jgi:hypothetical protein
MIILPRLGSAAQHGASLGADVADVETKQNGKVDLPHTASWSETTVANRAETQCQGLGVPCSCCVLGVAISLILVVVLAVLYH